jgi:dTDP-4-amino-4,6-dideoxygalactose transaminase
MTIRVLQPTFDEATKAAMMKVLDSGWVGQGPITAELEKEFAKRIGVKHAVAVNSGTAALDLCLKAYGIRGGELITPAMTFVSDALVGEWNDMRVTFADIDPVSLCIDPRVVQLNEDTKAVIAVHSHGRLAEVKALKHKLNEHKDRTGKDILLIEDCAHACHTPNAGLLGDIAIWSFQAVKTLPAGDGGMVTTNDDAIAEKLRDWTWCGINKSDTTYNRAKGTAYSYDYDIKHGGLKAYMNDLNAVLALGNLRRLDTLIDKRQKIQANYNEALKDLPGVKLPAFSHTVQYYTLETENRDAIIGRLAQAGISTSVHFKPLHKMSYWAPSARNPLPVTDAVWPKLLTLPCHDALSWDDQGYVIEKFQEAVHLEWKKGGQ